MEMDDRDDESMGSAAPKPSNVVQGDCTPVGVKPLNEGVRFDERNLDSSKGRSPRDGVRFGIRDMETEQDSPGRNGEKYGNPVDPLVSPQKVGFHERPGSADDEHDGARDRADMRRGSLRMFMPFLSSKAMGNSPKADSAEPSSSVKPETPRSNRGDTPGIRMRKTLGSLLSPSSRNSTAGMKPEKRKTTAGFAHNLPQSREHGAAQVRSPGGPIVEDAIRREPTARIFKRRARSASRGPRRGRERFRGIGALFSSSAARHPPRPPGAAQDDDVALHVNSTSKRILAVLRSRRVLSPSPSRENARANETQQDGVHKARSTDDCKDQ
jgi:hypothetical protein